MNKSENIIACILCCFSIFIFISSNSIPLMVAVEKSNVVNARFFPKLMGVVMFGLSIYMVIEGRLLRRAATERRKPEETSQAALDRGGYFRIFGVAAMSLLFYFLIEPLGFLLSGALFILGTLLALGNRKWYVLLSMPVATPLIVYLLFKTVLGAYLPTGIFYF
jgi:putative tricarboxylic transport membrane protein